MFFPEACPYSGTFLFSLLHLLLNNFLRPEFPLFRHGHSHFLKLCFEVSQVKPTSLCPTFSTLTSYCRKNLHTRFLIAELRRAWEHHNHRNRTTCMHRNRKPCISFFMVNMASGMDRGRERPTTTSRNMAAILHMIGRPRHAYGKPIVAIFNNLIYIQFKIYIYVIFCLYSI